MELSELTAYAREKFHIEEQHKWADFPGFSVLADPGTGKWAALLMRQWDSETGTEIQRCDIKCGKQILSGVSDPCLTSPFRMRGRNWVGVIFDGRTRPEVVFRLFDRAVYSVEQHGCTIVLDNAPRQQTVIRPETLLFPKDPPLSVKDPDVPERIRQMMRLYEYRDGSFAQKCRNFYRQGRFMEDYEDSKVWNGAYRRYFPTYHDLNVRQLRGYFTWRTGVRKGIFAPVSPSLAYLYLYELLNGIGSASPEDSLKKMQEFEAGFLDTGIGDPAMRRNLRRWMLEYAVIHDIPAACARRYADPAILKRDSALAVLQSPESFPDDQVFSALCAFAGKRLEQSPAVKKHGETGKHLFAEVWRRGAETEFSEGRNLFTLCFGRKEIYPWHPLGNAVYLEQQKHRDTDYALNAVRTYRCRGGEWREERYDRLHFDRKHFLGLLHETDRQLRRYLKTGHYLHEKPEEAWAAPLVEEVLSAGRQRESAPEKPEVTIDLSSLEQIRQDALITRDSLLTDEETQTAPETVPEISGPQKTAPDVPYRQVLLDLLREGSADRYMKDHHLMPSVAADAINEAFFDEIGDNILECDGSTVTLVEDYREDILNIFGVKK